MTIAAQNIHREATRWRRFLHQRPEIGFDVDQTAAFVADKLRSFGCDQVVTGIGRTGVVGIINGQKDGPTIGLRADMDALPIAEETDVAWASQSAGVMHACGHDGHTAMLLGAAKILSQTRNFAGRVALIFQPAEEGFGGAKAMLDDGLIEKFQVSRVFGMHNMPGETLGSFAITPGPIMASASNFLVKVQGKGGHGALPHTTKDPIVAACAMVGELQSIISRNTDPLHSLVISIGKIQGGEGRSVIPESVEFAGTVRTLSEANTVLAERRMKQVVQGLALAHDLSAEFSFNRNYPTTINHADETDMAARAARACSDGLTIQDNILPIMAAEDFSFMLNACPGAMIFIGNGDSANLHSPKYDFNDSIIPQGMRYWVQLVSDALRP